MEKLAEIQEDFQRHLLSMDEALIQRIAGANKHVVDTRLNIYTNAYRLRLLDALKNDYAVLEQYLGNEDFVRLGLSYIEAYPSVYFSINLFGQNLEKFLANTEPYPQKPYLSELAGFAWALNSAIDAANAPLLTKEDITAIPLDNWGNMVFTLHPSVCLYSARWNVLPIWQNLILNQQPPKPLLQEKPTYCLLWRKGTHFYYSTITAQEFFVIKAIQQLNSFAEICNGLLQWFPEDQIAGYAVNLLLQWINNEILSKVELLEK